MSIETTLARYDTRASDEAWRRHRRDCPQCARSGRGNDPCEPGKALREAKRQADAELERNRELDKAPPPNMDTLF